MCAVTIRVIALTIKSRLGRTVKGKDFKYVILENVVTVVGF